MSSTLTKIREQFLLVRKARDAERAAFLSTIIGKIESDAKLIDGVKTVTEEETIKVLKSFQKQNEEFLSITVTDKALREKEILAFFLPTQLSEAEIKAILVGTGITEMPKMMAYLKTNFAGLYDGKAASKIAKELAK